MRVGGTYAAVCRGSHSGMTTTTRRELDHHVEVDVNDVEVLRHEPDRLPCIALSSPSIVPKLKSRQ